MASRDTAKLLHPTEESLDKISAFVQMLVECPLNAAVAASRDDRLNV